MGRGLMMAQRRPLLMLALLLAGTTLVLLSGCGIRITSPEDQSQFAHDEAIRFEGTRRSLTQLTQSFGEFDWKSSIDPSLGSGEVLLIPDAAAGREALSAGQHTITAEHYPGLFTTWPWRHSITVTVTGLPMSVDARILGTGTFDIARFPGHRVLYSGLSTATVQDLRLVPGTYALEWMGKSTSFRVSAPPANCVPNAQGECCGILTLQ